MIRFAVPAALLLAMAAPSATSQPGMRAKSLAAALEGMTAGTPQTCISRRGVASVKSYKDSLLYVRSRKQVWHNALEGGCPGLDRDDILVFRSPSNDYCRGDIVETRSRSGGFHTGSCVLGAFVPYSK